VRQVEISLSKPDPFGQGLDKTTPSPWIFSATHFDKETKPVYFKSRYYSSKLKKWLTCDLAKQNKNFRKRYFNNPLSYFDLNENITEQNLEAQEAYQAACQEQLDQLAKEAEEHSDQMFSDLKYGVLHTVGVCGCILTDNFIMLPVEVYLAKESFSSAYNEYVAFADCQESLDQLISLEQAAIAADASTTAGQ